MQYTISLTYKKAEKTWNDFLHNLILVKNNLKVNVKHLNLNKKLKLHDKTLVQLHKIPYHDQHGIITYYYDYHTILLTSYYIPPL